MAGNNDDDRIGSVLEHLEDQLKAILEGQAALASVPGAIDELKQDMDEVKTNTKAIKTAVTDQTHQLNNHETRIADLEKAAT